MSNENAVNKEIKEIKKKNKKDLSMKHLKYLFGNYSEDLLSNLSYDYISIYSVTPAEYATLITEKLRELCEVVFNKSINNLVITEMTACIGGNVISFANNFKYVNAIELSEERYKYLGHNLKIFGLQNKVNAINGDSLVEIVKLKQDIIFFDIPWGGRSYKYKEKMNLYISKIPSYQACELVKRYAKMIVMKIPKNFNLKKFQYNIHMEIYKIIDLKKFKLLILI